MSYISNAFVSEAIECARRGGVDVTQLLVRAGITAPGSGTVTAEQFGTLWLAIAEAMNDEFFGNAARPMRPGSFALMGHAVCDADTVEIGLRRALRFLRVAIDEPYGTLAIQGGIAQITLHDSQVDRSAFAYRTYWVILHGLTCWLARTRIPLHGMALSCSRPKEADDYGDFFGTPVQFGAGKGYLKFDASYLKRPAKRSQTDLKRFLRAAPGVFLLRYKLGEGTVQQILKQLHQTPPASWPSLEDLAQTQGVGVATLRRRIAQDGVSFRSLRAEVLKDKAIHMLGDSKLTIAVVAHELGYSEPSAFFRAFKGWFNQSPHAWRQENKKAPR